MIRIVRDKYFLFVDAGVAKMVRRSDGAVVLTVTEPEAVSALIDCFTEDMAATTAS